MLKERLPGHCYRMWIAPLEFVASGDNLIRLGCPNTFSMTRVKKNYLCQVQNELASLGKNDIRIELCVKPAGTDAPRKEALKIQTETDCAGPACFPGKAAKPEQMLLPGLDFRFNSGRYLKRGYTFEDFVVGENNDFAYHASLSLAKGFLNTDCILYLFSGTGLGKSHLAQAAGHYIITNHLSDRVYYVTAEDFTNEMITSLKGDTIDQFKARYRKKCDVLILEDVHFFSGKTATQKELAITLDYLLEAGKKIILSGSYLPGDIPKLNDSLKSRMSLGLVSEIQVPDFETRVKILQKKSRNNGYNVPDDVIEYLAQELCDNVRLLESGLNGVAAKSSILGRQMDLNLAESVLSNLSGNLKKVSVTSIRKLICSEFSIPEKELLSPSRKKHIVRPRQMGIYLSRKYTDQSLKFIAKSFNRYHATAIYAINAVEKELKSKGYMAEQIGYLKKKIEAGNV